MRAEINKVESREIIEKNNKTQSRCLEKINKIDNPLAKRKREDTNY